MRFGKAIIYTSLAIAAGGEAKLFGKDKRELILKSITCITCADACFLALIHHPRLSTTLYSTAVYEDWDLQRSLQFLKEQGVAIKNSPTLQDAQKLIAERADAAATVRPSPPTWYNPDVSSGELLPLVVHKHTTRPTASLWLKREFLRWIRGR